MTPYYASLNKPAVGQPDAVHVQTPWVRCCWTEGWEVEFARARLISMKLDVSLLAWVGAVVGLLYAMGFGIFWMISPPFPGLGPWSVSSLAHSVAVSLMTLRVVIGDPWLTRIVPTWLLLVSALLLYAGAARFGGRKFSMAAPLTVCVLAALTFAWLTVVDPQPRLRQLFNSAVMAGFTGLAAIELFRERRGGLRLSAILNGCFALGMGGWFGFRAIRAMAFGYVELFEAGGFQLINMAMSSGYALACLFGTF